MKPQNQKRCTETHVKYFSFSRIPSHCITEKIIIRAIIHTIGGSHHPPIEGRPLIRTTHQSHRGERVRRRELVLLTIIFKLPRERCPPDTPNIPGGRFPESPASRRAALPGLLAPSGAAPPKPSFGGCAPNSFFWGLRRQTPCSGFAP